MSLVDIKTLKMNFAGDEDILKELIQDFKDAKEQMIQEMRDGHTTQDFSLLERSTHTLKGVVSNFFAEPLKQKLATLEEMGRKKKIENFEEQMEIISTDIETMLEEVDHFLKQNS